MTTGVDPVTGAKSTATVLESALPYQLKLQSLTQKPKQVGDAVVITNTFTGDLSGDGTWTLRQRGRDVDLTFVEHAATTGAIFNRIAPVSAWLLSKNHEWLMEDGLAGIQLAVNGCPNPAYVWAHRNWIGNR